MRSEAEIRREMDLWTREVKRLRVQGDRRSFDGLAASILVSALAWVLGEIEKPTYRKKID